MPAKGGDTESPITDWLWWGVLTISFTPSADAIDLFKVISCRDQQGSEFITASDGEIGDLQRPHQNPLVKGKPSQPPLAGIDDWTNYDVANVQ